MSVAAEIVQGLQEFAQDLKSGEKLIVTRLKRCDCNPDGTKGAKHCKRCRGLGFVTIRKTWP